MKIIDGKAISNQIVAELRAETDALAEKYGRRPGLAVLQVGGEAASNAYIAHKRKACEKAGFGFALEHFEAEVSQQELNAAVAAIAGREATDGMIVQLPLPERLDETEVIELIPPEKDVDGFTSANNGRMTLGFPGFLPATPAGVMELLRRAEIETEGKHCVVVGRSRIVGRPMSILLSGNAAPGNATVTLCHSRTQNLPAFTRQADLLIAAAGRPKMIKADMVKEGAVVIDVGIHREAQPGGKARLVGDVDFDGLKDIVSAITPVPGGVGPMTVAALLTQTLAAYKQAKGA